MLLFPPKYSFIVKISHDSETIQDKEGIRRFLVSFAWETYLALVNA